MLRVPARCSTKNGRKGARTQPWAPLESRRNAAATEANAARSTRCGCRVTPSRTRPTSSSVTTMGQTRLSSSTSRPSMLPVQLTLELTTLTGRDCLLTLRLRLTRVAISLATSRLTCASSSSPSARVEPSIARGLILSRTLPDVLIIPFLWLFSTKPRAERLV